MTNLLSGQSQEAVAIGRKEQISGLAESNHPQFQEKVTMG
jgi:hypothetical protein